MEDELTLITRVIWGMLTSSNPNKIIERLIKEEKEHVKIMLSIIGFDILSQTFEHNVEYGLLITRAKMVKDDTIYLTEKNEKMKKITFGSFYKPKVIKLKEKQYLNISDIDISGLKNEN